MKNFRTNKKLKYEIPPDEIEAEEILPWSSVRTVTLKDRSKVVRHVIDKLGKEHLGIYIPSLGYVEKIDLGRTLTVDYNIKSKDMIAWITI